MAWNADMDLPVGQIPPQDWMEQASTRQVIAALTAEGAEVRFVGGCVRDAVLKRPIRDIDIATHEPPERVMALLRQAGILVVPTGLAHGTVTAIVEGEHFEITTLRCDIETYGRHAKVAFTSDWAEDAARRDFTMNALFCDTQGHIYDPFDGLQDLGKGRVRFVGNARDRVEEDVLRLLRFFRFQAHYGTPPADPAALDACRHFAHRLPELSGERVAGELIKLLQAPDPASVLLLMDGLHVLDYILPEAQDFGRLRLLSWLETRALVLPGLSADPLRRLAAVLRTDQEGAAEVAQRLRLSNSQTDRLVALAAAETLPDPTLSSTERRRWLQRDGAERFRDLALLSWAAHKSLTPRPLPGETESWSQLLAEADLWQPVAFPLKGRDALGLGIPSGRRMGEMLNAVEAWWEAADYRPDHAQCLEHLRHLAQR